MKKISILVIMLCAVFVTQAQPISGVALKWSSYGNDSDTLNNTTAETTKEIAVGQNGSFSVTLTLSLISGTSGGKIYWEAGNNNGFYWPVDSATMTQQNLSSNSYAYSAAPFRFANFRVRIVPTGTQSQRIVAAWRKQ